MPDAIHISIVTPSYNQGGTIEKTIRSVLDQGYERFEHIVMDGGSTDGAVEVLRRYPHLQWVSEPDRGQAHAINKGLAVARGEVCAYLNSDDVYRPGCFERVAKVFADPACQVLVGDCDRIDEGGRVIGHDTAQLERPELLGRFWLWGKGVLIPQPAVFIRKSLLDEAGFFDESYDMAMDLEMWLRLARRTPFTFAGRTLAGFRVTPETKTSTRPEDMIEESRRAALAHRELVPAAERAEFVREVERQTVGHLLSVAEEKQDRAVAWRALRRRPGAIFSRRMLRALLLVMLMALPAAAWGPRGHRTVGLIAEEHISKRTKAALRDLLGEETLAEASIWADGIRREPEWEHTATWHYVNIADDATYATSRKDPRGDAIEAIERFRAALRDPKTSRLDRANAVRFLAHFVGDLHQPFHVGRFEDRGGNRIVLRRDGKDSNLHRVWDSGLLARLGLSSSQLAASLNGRFRKQAKRWRGGGPTDWAAESQRYRPQLYDFRGGDLGESYFERHRAFLEEQLMRAGVRLAAVLDELFAKRR